MWPYWLIFIFPAWFAVKESTIHYSTRPIGRRWGYLWWGTFILFSLVIGLRDHVGGDWNGYFRQLEYTQTLAWRDLMMNKEPAYSLLNWLGYHLGGIYFVNTVCAMIFTYGLLSFCKMQPRPWTALVVATPYLMIVVAMGYTRQSVAIGLVMLGLVALNQARVSRYILCVALAATFHISAVLVLPLALFAKSGRRGLVVLTVLVTTVVLYVLLVKKSVDLLTVGYIEKRMNSAGSSIRIAMNALPAVIFLLFQRKFVLMTPAQLSFWRYIAVIALGFVILLMISPASTAIDRMALYFIPLQLVIWSHVPDSLGYSLQSKKLLNYAVICFSAAVLFTWLFFSRYAVAWVPYTFYPWELLWPQVK